MRGLWETLLVLMLVVQVAITLQSQNTDQQLLGWLTSHGGWAHLSIEKVNEEGLRGVRATKDVKEGENMAFLPGDLIVEMGSERCSSAENAAVLLGRQHRELEWRNRMAPYWNSLPRGNGSILCRHLFTEQEAAMLQSEDMTGEIQSDQEHLSEVHAGNAKWWQKVLGMVPKTNLVRELGKAHNVTLQNIAHMACVVGAYAFACERGTWPFHYKAVCLLPLMDMLNHRRDGTSNAIVDQNKNGSYGCYAKRDIKAGEEVTQTYSPVTARADHSLLQYGFVEPFEEPLLAGVDSATGFDFEDDSWYGMHQHLIGPEETKRLQGILEGLGNSQDEDTQLLDGAKRRGDGRLAAIMQFRIQRKRALQQMIERLQKGHSTTPISSRAQQEL